MAGEYIEDLRIDLLGLNNNEIEKQYNLIPQGMSSVEVERNLSQALDPYSARSIVEDPNLTLKLKEEFNQILRDRDDLR
jgi:DNA-directed RNA polymerase II subunit RPB1